MNASASTDEFMESVIGWRGETGPGWADELVMKEDGPQYAQLYRRHVFSSEFALFLSSRAS